MDAGYSAVDATLRQVLARAECKYFSLTSTDNAYGSEVRCVHFTQHSFFAMAFLIC